MGGADTPQAPSCASAACDGIPPGDPLRTDERQRLGFLALLAVSLARERLSDLEGEVRVRIATSPEGRAVLEVRDDGSGIDRASLERIFDPFFTTREVGQGMGLGLPICHAIVTAHGGSLTVASEPGEGSTFRMELPPLA